MTHDTQPAELPRISRIVDVRIPLWGLIGAFAAAAYFIIGTWFTAGQSMTCAVHS